LSAKDLDVLGKYFKGEIVGASSNSIEILLNQFSIAVARLAKDS
jgi:hypothetical protein